MMTKSRGTDGFTTEKQIYMCHKIKEDLRTWNLISFLCLSYRILKVNILSRFVYLFQTLSITITHNQFAEWDELIKIYLGRGKKPLGNRKKGWGLTSLKNLLRFSTA